MDLDKLLAEVKPEDMDTLMEILPLLKEKVNIDKLIEDAVSGAATQAGPKDAKPAPAPAKTKSGKRRVSRKSAKAAAPKASSETGAPTLAQATIEYLKGKTDVPIGQIVQGVAKARNMKLTEKTENVIKVSIYQNKALKKVSPGRFELA